MALEIVLHRHCKHKCVCHSCRILQCHQFEAFTERVRWIIAENMYDPKKMNRNRHTMWMSNRQTISHRFPLYCSFPFQIVRKPESLVSNFILYSIFSHSVCVCVPDIIIYRVHAPCGISFKITRQQEAICRRTEHRMLARPCNDSDSFNWIIINHPNVSAYYGPNHVNRWNDFVFISACAFFYHCHFNDFLQHLPDTLCVRWLHFVDSSLSASPVLLKGGPYTR